MTQPSTAPTPDQSGVPLQELTDYLDRYLAVRDTPDSEQAVNGLQVECRTPITRIVAAVDASQASIDGAVAGLTETGQHRSGYTRGAGTLLLVHHGLLWDGNVPITGRRYRRLRALLTNDIALYAAHIPLDVHPEVGNNAVLARQLGLAPGGTFGQYRGRDLGVWGTWPDAPVARDALVAQLDTLLHTQSRLIPGGPPVTERVGVVTGAGGGMIGAARDLGLDTLVTGEGAHHTYFDAMEWGVNVIYAGHYATEQVGVQALAEHLALRFGLPWEFHWHPTGL